MAAGYSVTQPAKAASTAERGRPSRPTSQAQVVWSEVLRRRADWVPQLLPCPVELGAGEWRISSPELDRDLQEDLVIYPDGVHDYGTERGHGAVSLIREFGAVDQRGAIEFGGCPNYGRRDDQEFAVVSEPSPTVRRPTEQDAVSWLCKMLGDGTGAADATLEDLAKALGLARDAIDREIAAPWFDDLDNVFPISPPESWPTEQIRANRARLPVMRAIDPGGFDKLKDAWDAGFAMLPAEVEALADKEAERVRLGSGHGEAATAEHAMPEAAPEKDIFREPSFAELAVWPGDVRARLFAKRRPELVENLLQTGSYAIMFGDSNTGKSFLALDLTYAVAQGRAWAGLKTTRAGTLFIATEGADEILARYAALQEVFPIGAEDRPLVILPSEINLAAPSAELRGLAAFAGTIDDLGLIVVDTLPNAFGDGDENSTKDANSFNRNIRRLKEMTGATVLVVHHSGKDDTRGARGSSALRAGVDTEINVTATEAGLAGERIGHGEVSARGVLRVTKSRNGSVSISRDYELVGHHLRDAASGRTIIGGIARMSDRRASGTTKKPSEDQRLLLDTIAGMGATGAGFTTREIFQVLEAEALDSLSPHDADLKRDALRKKLGRMASSRFLVRRGDGWSLPQSQGFAAVETHFDVLPDEPENAASGHRPGARPP